MTEKQENKCGYCDNPLSYCNCPTEKQEETCENCGHKHQLDITANKYHRKDTCTRVDCECRKFKPKQENLCECGHQKQFHSDGKQRMVSMGHQYKGNYCTYLGCSCKKFKAKNHSPQMQASSKATSVAESSNSEGTSKSSKSLSDMVLTLSGGRRVYHEDYVRNLIKKLKKIHLIKPFWHDIDKLAGEELSK